MNVYKALATAHLARAEGTNDPALWQTATDEAPYRPYLRAGAQVRLSMALDSDDQNVLSLLDEARRTAEDLGAAPLLSMIDNLTPT